jgi:DNA primase
MSQNDVQQIKDRLGIEEVIGSYIRLEKAGKNLKARCPFHNEKTPSFTLSPDRGTYYCFGCGAKGDIFSFVQEFEGIDFPDALKILADRAGIELTKQSPEKTEKYNRLRSVLELSTKFFEVHLSRKPEVIEYLKNRGLTEETINEWRIGFVPKGWENLYSFLQKKGFKTQEIEEAGLIKKGDKGKYYDRFRSRIIFPIFDSGGRPVAFTGRIYEGKEDDAKYLNSPETPLFEKSKILYGFDRAKTAIRKSDFSILVEGQMDLIMSHQAGYKNAVASSGTALTEDQLKLISRISEKMVIAYDSDGAGFRASEKAWKMALNLGMDIKIAPMTGDEDPADVISKDVSEWKKIIKDSKHIIEIITEKILDEAQDNRSKGKMVSEKLIPYLHSISSSIDQAHFIKLISDKLDIPEDSIRREVDKYTPETSDSYVSSSNFKRDQNFGVDGGSLNTLKDSGSDNSLKIERELFGIIFWQENLEKPVIKHSDFTEKIKEIIKDDFSKVFEKMESEKENLIFSTEEIYSGIINSKGEIDKGKLKNSIIDLLKNLKLKYLYKERDEYTKFLKQAEEKQDDVKVEEYLLKIQELSKRINNLN